MANDCGKGKALPLKIGLSQAEKLALEETIYNRVIGQIEDITISGVRDNIQALKDEFPNGTGGIWVTKDDGKWNYYDIVLKDWVAGGLFIEEQEVTNLQNTKLDKDMLDWGTMPTEITNKNQFYKEVSNVFATTTNGIYMFGTPEELDRFWTIWEKPIGLVATHVYIAIKPLSNKSSRHSFIMWVFASNYANPYFRVVNGYNGQYVSANDKGWISVNKLATIDDTIKEIVDKNKMDAVDLEQMIDNPYPNEITKDLNQDATKVEFHLDRQFVASLDQETTLAVARPSRNNQVWTLDGTQVATLKGLRAFIKFAYNGDELVLSQDIRFPKNRANYQWFVSTPIPNPQIFSEKILVQYNTETDELSLKSSGGNVSADMQIIEVVGIK